MNRRLRAVWPSAALLTLAVLIATACLSWQRPPVQLDIGEGRDSQYLTGFHDREISALTQPTVVAWPTAVPALTVRGGYGGVVLARLVAADGADPTVIARASAVAVNGVRVEMPRRNAAEIWAKVPAAIAAAPQLSFVLVSALNGDPPPPADQIASLELAPAATYRWTTDNATLALPHVGRGSLRVTLDALIQHSDGSSVNARLRLNDTAWLTLPDADAPRRYHLLAPAALVADGQLTIAVTAATFNDPRPLGLLLFDLNTAPLSAGSFTDRLPALRTLLPLLVTTWAVALLAWYVLRNFAPQPLSGRRSRLLAPAFALLLLAAATVWLSRSRLPGALMIDRLALFSLFALLLAVPLQHLTARLLLRVDPATPRWAVGAVLSLFWSGFLLKGFGMLTPAYMGIDVYWHMDKVRDILFAGALPGYYGVNSPLNDITMPTAEWGSNPPVIPYSPWFHMLATVYAIFPWSMELTASLVALLMDLSRIPLLAALTRSVSRDWRAPLLTAALITVTPVTFLLHNWGNVPTAAGLWLCWLVIGLLWLEWPRLQQPRHLIGLTLLLVLTFLIYTVTGVFMGGFLIILTLLVLLNARRGADWAVLRAGLRPLWLATGSALVLVLAIYYGQYIVPIVTQTLPYLATVASAGPEQVGVARQSFSSYALNFLPHLGYWFWPGRALYYGLLIPLLALPFGYYQLRDRPLPWLIASAWGALALLFFIVGFRVSMVDKQLFFLIPLIALTAGLAADRLWVRARWTAALIIAVLAATLLSALWLWAYRISVSPIYT